MKTLWSIVAALVVALPAAGKDYDRWYVIEMDGQRAGWMHMRQHTIDDRIETITKTRLEIRRASAVIAIEMNGRFVESPDGEPILMESVQSFGTEPIVQKFTFGAESVSVETTVGGQTATREDPLPEGAWLTPAAASSFIEQRLRAGADTITVRSIDPTVGLAVVETTMTREQETTLKVLGRTIDVTEWSSVSSLMPGIVNVEYLDHEGVPVISEMTFGQIELRMTATTREDALALLDPPEMMVSTLIKSPKPIPDARATTRASFVLTVPDGPLGVPPSEGAQIATRIDDRTVRVDVDVHAATPGQPGDSTTESSTMITSADDRIVKLARDAAKTAPDIPAKRAEALRRFTNHYIDEKSLGVGFATAAEVARTREGDCTEHAVLLAAMLRADGIPSRIVSGLVYVPSFAGQDDIFGYHMWTQALLERDGEMVWVDLDATMPDNSPFDATHIGLVVSDLGDGEGPMALAEIAPLLGRLEIQIESIE